MRENTINAKKVKCETRSNKAARRKVQKDHVHKHVAGKLAPGGAEHFRIRHNADDQMEYWLESADLIKDRKKNVFFTILTLFPLILTAELTEVTWSH